MKDQDLKNTYLIDATIEKTTRKIKMKPAKSVKKIDMMNVIEEQKKLLRETQRQAAWASDENIKSQRALDKAQEQKARLKSDLIMEFERQ